MNPTLTSNVLNTTNSIENSSLSGRGAPATDLEEDESSSEFTVAMQELLSTSGKPKPLDLAALEGLDIQQLTDLAEQMGIQLPPELLSESIGLKQSPLSTSALEDSTSPDGINLIGNPNANELIKTAVINEGVLEEGFTENNLIKQQTHKADLFSNPTTEETLKQAILKKEPDIAQALKNAEIEPSKLVKEFAIKDVDISRDLLAQVGRQDMNLTKLADQLVSADKPLNTINSISHPAPTVQSQLNTELSGMTLSRIPVPVQQAGWGEAVGNRLMMMVNDKVQSANIHLNPKELGPIELKISVKHDQATVHFVSNNTVVRDAIEDAFPRLKEMFSQNGLSLADANVSQQSSQQQSNAYTRDENGTQSIANNDLLDADDLQTEHTQLSILDRGLIDHYV